MRNAGGWGRVGASVSLIPSVASSHAQGWPRHPPAGRRRGRRHLAAQARLARARRLARGLARAATAAGPTAPGGASACARRDGRGGDGTRAGRHRSAGYAERQRIRADRAGGGGAHHGASFRRGRTGREGTEAGRVRRHRGAHGGRAGARQSGAGRGRRGAQPHAGAARGRHAGLVRAGQRAARHRSRQRRRLAGPARPAGARRAFRRHRRAARGQRRSHRPARRADHDADEPRSNQDRFQRAWHFPERDQGWPADRRGGRRLSGPQVPGRDLRDRPGGRGCGPGAAPARHDPEP